MDITVIEIETLNLQQLVKRPGWENYSVDNILQFAQNGHFGLYFNVYEVTGTNKTKTYRYVQECVDFLVNHPNNSEEAKKLYRSLDGKLKTFIQEKPYLLEHYNGSARLALQVETEILQAMFYCTVDKFRRDLQLQGHKDDNDYFGFQIVNGRLIAPAYWFPGRKITSENLFVRVNQIENFERKLDPIVSKIEVQDVTKAKNSIIFIGRFCKIIFNGKELDPLLRSKGLHYLGMLLKKPHNPLSAHGLMQGYENNIPDEIIDNDTEQLNVTDDIAPPQEKLDQQAINEYKQRVATLREKIEDAIEKGDVELQHVLKQEMNDILSQLQEGTYKNKSAIFTTTTRKRTNAVSKSIWNSIEKIGEVSVDLKKHLHETISTGNTCTYNPREPIEWL